MKISTLFLLLVIEPIFTKIRHETGKKYSKRGFTDEKKLTIATLIPFENKIFGKNKLEPAAVLAQKKIVEYGYLTPYKLDIKYRDSKCTDTDGMNEAINFYVNGTITGFLGPICDYTLAPLARQLSIWKFPLITVGGLARDFGKKASYPITRAGPASPTSLVDFFKKIRQENKWKKLKAIWEFDSFSSTYPRICRLITESLVLGDTEAKYDTYKLLVTRNSSGPVYTYSMPDKYVEELLKEEVGNKFAGREIINSFTTVNTRKAILIKRLSPIYKERELYEKGG
ncbi:unnamed protein product [Dimorphilus gyrociliatus]|uniref:Receptor ligand binding region domain-containing protein n=1 Tax=Dimorphilus gyrociliatus TaxID=2664684 RepID=A0A7I8V6D4_9ANNE|nr:unnamed protein product [Dimorphilus gyrociliatus]